ncbi:PH domain-containing protein [Robbsia sp. Bb-Pol-6]|uniref:PH domain-containing protein n=1 Tax=Robbsia betulipollinis TaxID=2981849 RepID=A0ABT3ZPT1_9BURK|nr:PH domain-containing protein [Robbsia betulipollinis]MCY0388417.1 PH domain-containing protein [Robbsia betulipollinis]
MTDSNLVAFATEKRIIFDGSPSQVVNAATFVKGLLALVVIVGAYIYALGQWPVPLIVPTIAVAIVVFSVGLSYLQTAFTEIIIDSERITLRRGILNKRVTSLELFRIQDLTSIHPWWQRMFNVGAIVVMTSDSNNPTWVLPGIKNAEEMRSALNQAAIALRDRKGIREVNMGRI